jgi:hypothetical protein
MPRGAALTMRFYWFLLGVLGVWRITHLLQAEDGPSDLVAFLRRKAGDTFWGRLLDCFYCLSLWTALPFALGLGADWKERILLWPTLSAAAILVERITMPAVASYVEDKEENHAVLRPPESESRTGHDGPPAT